MKILTEKKQKRLMFDLIDSDRRAFFKFGGTTYFITRDGKVLSSRGDVPNPDNLPYVLHIDGDRENNICGNLEWSAKQSNHAVRVKG